MKIKGLIISLVLLMVLVGSVSATKYVRQGATGTGSGNDWTNAYTSLPSTLIRGETYYIADGSYGSYTFDDAESGTQYITIKKAIESDHGTNTGWQSSYGDGQAVFSAPISFQNDYYIFDGNGNHVIPSDNTNDYGFKVEDTSTTNWAGLVRVGTGTNPDVDYVTLRYTHVYNAYQGGDCSHNVNTVSIRMYPAGNRPTHVKIQNNFVENSGKDGIQFSSSNDVLLERNYIKNLGLQPACSPDQHGQAIQMFGTDNVVIRWNICENLDGQGLIASSYDNAGFMRIYGNIFFQSSSDPEYVLGPWRGFFSKWNGNVENLLFYGNTGVNFGGEYPGSIYPLYIYPDGSTSGYSRVHNNLYYNLNTITYYGDFIDSYDASGGGDSTGGSNEQTGLTSSIFNNYAGYDFSLSFATDPGIDLTQEPWWDDSSDPFFGQLDYNVDIAGNVRGNDGNIDRGAYEYVVSGPDTTPPVRSNLLPTGVLSSGTTQATLSLTTNEPATCKYSLTPGVSYSSMTNTFTSTGGTTHSRSVSVSDGNSYNYYVRCSDTLGNVNTNDEVISFSVANPPVCGDGTCDSTELCGTTDNTPKCNSDCGECLQICDNIVSLYHFNSDSIDSKGTNDGSVSGATVVTSQSGFGEAYSFDGSSSYINLGSDSSLDLSEMTFSAWVNTAGWSSGGFGAIASRGAGSNTGFEIYTRESSTSFSLWDGTSVHSTIGPTFNSWQHLAVILDGSNYQFYVDGTDAGSGSWDLAASGVNNFYIGSLDGASEFFNGLIDEVAIWNRSLTAQEINDIKNSGSEISCGGSSSTCLSGADTNFDNDVDIGEIIDFISRYKNFEVSIGEVIDAITEYKYGCS